MAQTKDTSAGYRLQIQGKDTSIPISLKGTRWLIGRHPSSDIHLSDPLVSRRHALLYLDEDRLVLEDLSPRNPTKVNGKEIQGAVVLVPGDVLLVGDTQIRVTSLEELSIRVRPGHLEIGRRETVVHTPPKLAEQPDEVLDIVNRLANALVPVSTADDAALLTLQLIKTCFPCRAAMVARYATPRRMRILASFGLRQPERGFEVPKGLIRLLAEKDEPICLEDPTPEDLGTEEPFWDTPPKMIMLAPVRTRAGITGFLYMERDAGIVECTPRDLALATALVRILASRLDTLDLVERLLQENIELRERKLLGPRYYAVSEPIRKLLGELEPLARSRAWLAVLGEQGSGREALVRHLHNLEFADDNNPHPFVVIEAAACEDDEELREELLGAEDREALRLGKVVAAHRGTLLIRDIETVPPTLQAAVVEILRKGRVEQNSGSEPLDVRLVVSSSLPSEELFAPGVLHSELVAEIGERIFEIPPLRKRPEDIALLAGHFLEEFAERGNRPIARLSPRALDMLRAYHWPENVRELKETIVTAAILARGHTIYPKHLPRNVGGPGPASGGGRRLPDLPSLEEVEKEHILRVLSTVGGNKARAAEVLGIAYSTLYAKLRKYASERAGR